MVMNPVPAMPAIAERRTSQVSDWKRGNIAL